MLLFISSSLILSMPFLYFNTSHVTVYLVITASTSSCMLFQYISCYCLSCISSSVNFPVYWFQYISCYCLSIRERLQIYQNNYFNTSHVTVYPANSLRFNFKLSFQYISCYCLSCNNFILSITPWDISIHLMLLFIYFRTIRYT